MTDMLKVHAQHLLPVQNLLGEGPLWHPLEQKYYWVDIERGRIYSFEPNTGKVQYDAIDTTVGALGFRSSGGLILACGKGFAAFDLETKDLQVILDPIGKIPDVRLNDGKVDPAGRFWAGSLDRSGNGALYRLDADHTCHTMLHNIQVSNGLAWTADQQTFYYTDTGDLSIYKFDFEPQSAQISNRRIYVQLPADRSNGSPDGLTIDAEGFIWSAHWDGGKVTRYNPDGQPVLEVLLPVSRVTSCTFGGPDLQELFITTASTGLTDAQKGQQPLAGDVFVYHTAVKGVLTPFFAG